MANPNGNLNNMIDSIKKSKESLYSDIYYNDNTSNREIKLIKDKIDSSIRKISNSNFTNTGVNNISSLYSKVLNNKDKTEREFITNLNMTLADKSIMDNVMSIYSQNTWVRQMDSDIDMICKYMPKLEEALKVRMEHVLSADHFTKDPIIITSTNIGKNEKTSIDDNLSSLEKKYNIYENFTRWYKNIEKYGEEFIYIVPFNKAIKELLDARDSSNALSGISLRPATESIDEAFTALEDSISSINQVESYECIHESIEDLTDQFTSDGKKQERENILKDSIGDIKIDINKSGILLSAIKDKWKTIKFCQENGSLFFNEAGEIGETVKDYTFKNPSFDSMATDGTLNLANAKTNNKINIPGCVVRKLDHSMVKPLYIDDICLGYFYIECDRKMVMEQTTYSSTIGGIRPSGSYSRNAQDPLANNTSDYVVIKNIASKISEKITAKFVNANQDLSEEIYHILKYNSNMDATGKISKISITFIPPEDLNHVYFDFDEQMKRGVSGLFNSVFPAKLFSYMYISNCLQILTRGNDKRIIYVRQGVDKNIAGVLGNVINQLQLGNYGIRQIESMSNVLNMIGRFNDYYIPRGQSGDAPIDFEVMPGQQTEPRTELMNMLEEMAINATGVPIEVISIRQQTDYATHLTMTNTKFLQEIYSYQSKTERIFSKLLTKIYNFEFNPDGVNKEQIKVTLPPPMYLNAINGSQILDSVNSLAENMSKLQYPDSESTKQAEFARILKKLLSETVLPKNIISRAKDEAEMGLTKQSEE